MKILVEHENNPKHINIPVPHKKKDIDIQHELPLQNKEPIMRDDHSEDTESLHSIQQQPTINNKSKFFSEERTKLTKNDVEQQPSESNKENEVPFSIDMYANPKKKNTVIDDDNDADYTDSDEYSDMESSYDSRPKFSRTKDDDAISYTKKPKKTISDTELRVKKKEMLLKLYEAEQNGYILSSKYGMHSEIEDMEAEFNLYEKKMEESYLVDFLQDGLMLFLKGIEIITNIYNPLGLRLNGIQDRMYDKRDKLEHVFRKLAQKYGGEGGFPPEINLLFIIGGVILMTHIGNKASEDPGFLNKLVGGDIMNSVQNILQGIQKQTPTQQQPQPSNVPTPSKPLSQDDMKPPPIDLSNILSNLLPPQQQNSPERDSLPFRAMNVPNPNPFPESTRTRDVTNDRRDDTQDNDTDRFSEVSSDTDSHISIPRKSKKKKEITIY